MIVLTDEQVEDCRKGIQDELSMYLGWFVLVRVDLSTDDLRFRAIIPLEEQEVFDAFCAKHITRVSKVNYDMPPEGN